MATEILIVDTDRDALAAMATALQAAGYRPTLADDFEDATALLKSHTFEVLLTAHRLGAHNGLHLVLRARAERSMVGAMVTTTTADPVLEAEANAFGALCLVAPWQRPDQLLSALSSLTNAQPR
jgi:DNA-binding NtrC family response regulator